MIKNKHGSYTLKNQNTSRAFIIGESQGKEK
jgi:hypothetical protein